LLPHAKLLRQIWARGVPRREAILVPAIAPLVRFLARKAYDITPESAQRSLERIRGVFRRVEEQLAGTRRFLVGDRFTAADLTFAALAAPVLLPPECRATHPALEALPGAMREEVLRMRETGAGSFALRLFAQQRGSP
jgi:glutathione S-transferase